MRSPISGGAVGIAALAFALGPAVLARGQAPSQPRLPESAQGKVAEAVIQAFNAADVARLESVLAEHGTAAMTEVRPFKEWAALLVEQQKERFGPVRIERVFRVHETVLVALVQGEKGPWLDFRFEFEPQGSPRLSRIRFEPSDPPKDAAPAGPRA